MGVTGGLMIPTAEMQADGTFMGGGNFLPKQLMPDSWDYNTGNYFVNLTFLPFVELAYRCTFLKGEFTNGNTLQQDRSVSVRLRALKEGAYLPALVLGSNDAFTSGEVNALQQYEGKNRYFSGVYLVATKHLPWQGNELGLTLGANFFTKSGAKNRGLFAGVSVRPTAWKGVSFMGEFDGSAVSLGGAVRLLDHLAIHAFVYDFRTVSAGIRYELILLRK